MDSLFSGLGGLILFSLLQGFAPDLWNMQNNGLIGLRFNRVESPSPILNWKLSCSVVLLAIFFAPSDYPCWLLLFRQRRTRSQINGLRFSAIFFAPCSLRRDRCADAPRPKNNKALASWEDLFIRSIIWKWPRNPSLKRRSGIHPWTSQRKRGRKSMKKVWLLCLP